MSCITPNLIIGGAPKCGTTALANYLRTHPSVFMSDPKEPFYWASDMPAMRQSERITTLDDYRDLFSAASPDATVIGEGSTLYLYSDVAIANALAFNPKMNFIFMVRRPAEVAHAFHMQMCFHEAEDQADFQTAWNLQPARLERSELIPTRCRAAKLLQYQSVAALGTQLEAAFRLVPRDQVHVIVFDDFKADPAAAYGAALSFLDLCPDDRSVFPKENAAMQSNHATITRWMRSRPVRNVTQLFKRTLHGRSYDFARQLKHRMMFKRASRPELAEDFQRHLSEVFRPEVDKLESILGRDLSHWKTPIESTSA